MLESKKDRRDVDQMFDIFQLCWFYNLIWTPMFICLEGVTTVAVKVYETLI